jgi:hypothetical protein
MMELWRPHYLRATPEAQLKICRLLMWAWRAQEPAGRFIEKSPIRGSRDWHELDNKTMLPVVQTFLTRDVLRMALSARTLDEVGVDALWLELMGLEIPEAIDLIVNEAPADADADDDPVHPEAMAHAMADEGLGGVDDVNMAGWRAKADDGLE